MTQNALEEVYVLAAVRTPLGRIGGALAGVRPDDLAATAVRGVVERLPDLDPAAIDEAYLGDANGAGVDGSRAVAVGDADVVLAGGVESMSRAPWVLPKPAKGYPTGH